MTSITAPLQKEFERAQGFWNDHIINGCTFSVTVDGRAQAITGDHYAGTTLSEEDGRTLCTRHYKIGQLAIRQEAVLYKELPICEWTLYIKNDSSDTTPRVRFTALDHDFESKRFVTAVHRHIGSDSRYDDHMPYVDALSYRKNISVSPFGGRSTNHEWPYFSIRLADYGINLAIGWLGQWQFDAFNCNEQLNNKNGGPNSNYTNIKVSQKRFDSVIYPDEEFRSPRVVLQFWEMNGLTEKKAVRRAQNIFRKYMRAHNMPRYADGSVPTHGLAACSSHQCCEMQNATTENQKEFISAYADRGVRLDYWWMDAGWYEGGHTDWGNLGTWKEDTQRFPKGLREISDFAKTKGYGIVLWHEPERVFKGSELSTEHPEFLLSPKYPDGSVHTNENYSLLNFGNEEARQWITKRMSGNLSNIGVTVYRQDFNTEPLDFIDPNETEDRMGAIENHYCCGMLRYWDDLTKLNPGLLIDECASGGRRDDIDAMKRALMFIRSDYLFEPISQQCHTGWLAEWMPFFGTGILIGESVIDNRLVNAPYDYYAMMSMVTPHPNCCIDPRDDYFDWQRISNFLKDWRDYAPCYSGDYYPLTEITLNDSDWAVWQFNRFDEGDGIVQAFRRPNDVEKERVFALNDLDPDAIYTFRRYEKEEKFELTGKEAMSGFKIALNAREAVIFKYTKKQ